MKHNFDITQFLKESNGQFSGLRLAVLIIVITSCSNAGIAINAVANGTLKDTSLFIAVGSFITSMITSALAMKVWQKQGETEAEPSDPPSTAGGPPKA
jgi:hypothetical protein